MKRSTTLLTTGDKMDRQQMTDHDLLIRIDERTENMEDHDERIRELEKNQNKIMGIVVVIGSAITVLMNLLFHFWDSIRWK